MAAEQSHISFSLILAAVYSFGGMLFFRVPPEHALLAAVLIFVAGMLPNLDQPGGSTPKELGSLLAAVSPLIVLELFPVLHDGGVVRVALVVVASYALTKLVLIRGMRKLTSHRGMLHSIPAAIITGQLTYLLFWDSSLQSRLYLGLAAFVGFMCHLLVDAASNIDLIGKAMGEKPAKAPVLKLLGGSFGSNAAAYGLLLVLSWVIARDFFPALRFQASITY